MMDVLITWLPTAAIFLIGFMVMRYRFDFRYKLRTLVIAAMGYAFIAGFMFYRVLVMPDLSRKLIALLCCVFYMGSAFFMYRMAMSRIVIAVVREKDESQPPEQN